MTFTPVFVPLSQYWHCGIVGGDKIDIIFDEV